MDPVTLSMAETDAKRKYVPKAGTRLAIAPVTAPNGITAASVLSQAQRTMLKLPFGALRWRVGFRNMSLKATTILTTPCTITNIYTGAPKYQTATNTSVRWAGDTVATPVLVAPGFDVPIDGTFGWSAWITTDPFVKDVEKVISWGFTCTAAGTGLATGNSFQGVKATTASNAAVAALSGATIGTNSLYLDVLIEYEFAESVQCVVFIGDSLTTTYGTSPVVPGVGAIGAGALPHESWPMMAGAMGGFAAVNLGVGSTTIGDWATAYPHLWTRTDGTGPYNAAVVSLGTNGLGGGLAQYSSGIQTVDAKIRSSYTVNTLWHTTITPRGLTFFGRLTNAPNVGATSIVMDTSPAIGQILIGSGSNMELINVSAVSGTGPYTATVGALVFAHVVGEPVSWSDEMNRRIINSFIRNMPDGITGVFDFEKLLEASTDSNFSDQRYVGSDQLHFYRGSSALKAAMVVGSGVRPLFGQGT